MISYWLMPAEPQRTVFVSAIERLARTFDAPVFEPHVTLYSGDDDETLATALVTKIAARERPFELVVSGIEHSEQFTKTLFVQLVANDAVRRISAAFVEGSSSKAAYDLNPHLSLLYAEISPERKAAAAQRTELDLTAVSFDAVQAIAFSSPIRSRADVESWRAIAKAKLGG